MYKTITCDYYEKHAQDFEDLGYSKIEVFCCDKSLDIAICNDLRAKGFDTITVYKGRKPVISLGKKVNPFDENCKIWMPQKKVKLTK